MTGRDDNGSGQSLFEFPCEFPIKAMGSSAPGFPRLVQDIVERHVDDADLLEVRERSSSAGRYVSVTCLIRASSRAQIDSIYMDLNSEPDVLMTL
jgi:putative lipoic acid-binding regulatory protein